MTSEKEWKKRGKDASPENTIKKIEGILKLLGYDIIYEERKDQSLEDCFSCRVHLSNGADFAASNGKGMTKELSLASAYGELIERVQNRTLMTYPRRDDEKYDELLIKGAPLYDPITGENEPECFTKLIERLAKTVGDHSILQTDEDIIRNLLSKLSFSALDNKIPTTPYYSLRKDKIEYLPDAISFFTGSNGLAAGNSYEEALIEGISELLERYSQAIIMDGKIIPPSIPRDYIAQYPHIMKVINDIEESGRYKVRMLDCSLEKELPVVCGLIIDTNTGCFGAKFGAQPNIAIAMERVFTEAMQGSNLENFANNSYPDIGLKENVKRKDKWNNIKVAIGSMTAQLLMDKPSYEFKAWENVENKSNAEIMRSLISLMESLGSDIYVRDSGYLGFPSVNIYATGISEIKPVDALNLKIDILSDKVAKYFMRIDRLTDAEVEELALFASIKMGAVLENTISAISQLYFKDDIPVFGAETEFLYAVCLYRLGNISKASEYFKLIARKVSNTSFIDSKIKLYALAVHYYVAAKLDGIEEERAYELVYNLCGEVAKTVSQQFVDPMTVLEKIYPVCENKPLLEITEGGCQYHLVHDFFKKLVDKENDNPMQLETLRAIFKE